MGQLGSPMTRIESIEHQVAELSDEELVAFRSWFAVFDAELWDRQFEADARNGKLDAFADEALREHNAGLSTEL